MSNKGKAAPRSKLTHVDEENRIAMVAVGDKPVTERQACAEGHILFPAEVASQLRKHPATAKGRIDDVARIAGIMGAKGTSALIPLCHGLQLDHVSIETHWQGDALHVSCRTRCWGRTGVEMEALTGVSVALLALYDMSKALTKNACIGGIRLLEKSGGRSGAWSAQPELATGMKRPGEAVEERLEE
jgi:cyclic pyranopterin phosphate synthase